jgi:thiol-disulfide isomerase/thioredoxin
VGLAFKMKSTKQSGSRKPLRKRNLNPIASSVKLLSRFVTLALLAMTGMGCDNAPSPGEMVLQHTIGQNVANLQVQTLDGTPLPFADLLTFNGQPSTVVNIWATWCTPCVKEMPTLDALGKSGRARVIAIATDASATVVKDFLRQQPWGTGLDVWHDPRGIITREALSAKALPSTYVLDASLTITYAVAGERDWASWQPGQAPDRLR